MSHEKISISGAINKAWQITNKNFGFTTGLLVILTVLSGISQMLRHENILASLLMMIIDVIIGMGVIKIALKLAREEKPEYKELYDNFHYFWNYFAVTLLYGLMVTVGFIVFVIPGIYLAVKYAYAPYFVMDKDVRPFEAFRLAGKLSQGHWWELAGLVLIMIGILILGVLALLIGLLWAYPVVIVTSALVYLQLSGHEHS